MFLDLYKILIFLSLIFCKISFVPSVELLSEIIISSYNPQVFALITLLIHFSIVFFSLKTGIITLRVLNIVFNYK